MKLWVIWRRFRRASPEHNEHHLQYLAQIEALMRRANPFASWNERANWMIDISEWLRRGPRESRLDDAAWRRIKHQRIRFLLDWLDSHRDVKRVVQASLQKTLREAVGPELFCATGLPREPAFFSELFERIIKKILPKSPSQMDLPALFTSMFPKPADADWLLGLDAKTLSRLWKLCADDGIAHNYRQQIDEALTYLVSMVIAVGISPDFRQRLEPRMPLQATPFMALQRELGKYLMLSVPDEAALRSVRMLVAVCQAQTDRIYAHLDEYGVSVSLVYRVERMRAQLMRMARLIDLRSAPPSTQTAGQVQALLVELVDAHHHRSTVHGLVSRSFSLLARKMVERNADHGEQYIVRDTSEYRTMLKSAWRGGLVGTATVLVKAVLPGGAARFFEGALASINYAATFAAISLSGGMLAGRQPAVTAPALAACMHALDTADGRRKLLTEVAGLLRAQAATVFGNLLAVMPLMAVISLVVLWVSGAPAITPADAHTSLRDLSLLGPTPLYAAITGVMLWLASLSAGFADNWFALRNMREALTHQRRFSHALGSVRAERYAAWLERHLAEIVGSLSLAILLGMSPVLARFFGLPFDIRHVTLSAGAFAGAASSLGWGVLTTAEFWLAGAGILSTALLNVGVALTCAMALALRARDVPPRMRRAVFGMVLRRFAAAPRGFLLPVQAEARITTIQPAALDEVQEESETPRSKLG